MKTNKKLHSVALASTFLVLLLILFSSIVSAAPAQSASSVKTYAYITNHDSNTVSVIDTAIDKVIATVNVGDAPIGVAVSPTKVYIVNSGYNYTNGTVSVIDTATNTVIATVPVGKVPFGPAITPDGKKVYVTNWFGTTVSVIDTATDTVTATVNVGDWPREVAVSPDGTKVYVTRPNSNLVTVIDIKTDTVTETINIGNEPLGIAITPDGNKAYIATGDSGMVSVIDLKTNTVSTVNLGGRPWYVAVTPDGKSAYVVDIGTDNIYVIDTATNTVVDTVKVGASPGGVAVTPDGKKAYVVFSNSVGVIDTATNTVIATVPVGKVPEVLGQFIGSVQVKTTPTITWNNPADITAGTALSSTQLNAVAKDPDSETIIDGVFTYNPAAETVLNAGMGQTLHVDFVPTDTANYTAASKEVTINVLEEPAIPVADFSASPTTGKAPLAVAFTDSSTGSPTTWSWNFGDKSISTDKNPVHTYNKQGKYTVSLTVGNAAGSNTKTIKKYITVEKK